MKKKRKRKIGDKGEEDELPGFGFDKRQSLVQRIGCVITTPVSSTELFILQMIVAGHAGVVYKVKRLNDQCIFALKVPKKDTDKHLWKLRIEKDRNEELGELDLPYARIVEEGRDYILKEWIEGIRGDEWFVQWNKFGRPLDNPSFVKLMELFDTMASRGVYVQNLKDLNMIYDGIEWIIIDVGYLKHNLEPLEALERFYDTFDYRWNNPKKKTYKKYECPQLTEIREDNPYSKDLIDDQRDKRIEWETGRDERLAKKKAKKKQKKKKKEVKKEKTSEKQ